MTLTELAPAIRRALPQRISDAYQQLDEVADLLEYPGPLTEGQAVIHRRIRDKLASLQSDLDRLELSTRGGAS